MNALLPENEGARLNALRQLHLLDTDPENSFDDLVRLASHICHTPTALISLVDDERQWFKARIGLDVCETPREQSFCAHAILRPDDLLVVPDARADERFRDNPLVTGPPHVRFYAGAPLVLPGGFAIGSLCVIDYAPRTLSNAQADALCVLARQVVTQITLRQELARQEQARIERENTLRALRESEAALQKAREELETRVVERTAELALANAALREQQDFLRSVIDTAPSLIFAKDREGRYTLANRFHADLYGTTPQAMLGKRDADFSPSGIEVEQYLQADREVMDTRREKFIPEETVTDAAGNVRWFQTVKRPLLSPDGTARQILGIATEITRRKHAETARRAAEEQIRGLNAQMERRLSRIAALHEIDRAITASLDLRLTLGVCLTHTRAQLRVDAARVLIYDAHAGTLETAAGQGFRDGLPAAAPSRLEETLAGQAVRSGQGVALGDLSRQRPGALDADSALAGNGFAAYFAAPLISKGQVQGVLEVLHRAPLVAPGDEWLDFLDTLAGQAAIAVDNDRLFENLRRSNLDLTLAYDTTIEGWSRALDLRDKETEGHTQRVTQMTLRLARALGLSGEELAHLRRGALLHDIGKMGIPDGILLKPGPLSDDEWVIMKKHPACAYEMLSPIAFLRPALDIPYCHHEKWDGTGYPRGLKGEQIPLAARLFAVVDVWDALRSDRPYRTGWPEEKVCEHIRRGANSHFDSTVVDAFLRFLAEATGITSAPPPPAGDTLSLLRAA